MCFEVLFLRHEICLNFGLMSIYETLKIKLHIHQDIFLELHSDFLCQNGEKESRLTPGRIDFVPFNRNTGQSTQPRKNPPREL
jgi:hypothetical protein